MVDAKFVHGTPHVQMMDYTPSSAVTGGSVVVVGDRPLIAHRDIAADEQGALAAGGGVYEVMAGEAIAAGKLVYWDDTNKKVIETKSTNTTFGYMEADSSASADEDMVRVHHVPGLDLIA